MRLGVSDLALSTAGECRSFEADRLASLSLSVLTLAAKTTHTHWGKEETREDEEHLVILREYEI